MKLLTIKKCLEISEGLSVLIFTMEDTETGNISKGSFTGSKEILIELFKPLESDDFKIEYE